MLVLTRSFKCLIVSVKIQLIVLNGMLSYTREQRLSINGAETLFCLFLFEQCLEASVADLFFAFPLI